MKYIDSNFCLQERRIIWDYHEEITYYATKEINQKYKGKKVAKKYKKKIKNI